MQSVTISQTAALIVGLVFVCGTIASVQAQDQSPTKRPAAQTSPPSEKQPPAKAQGGSGGGASREVVIPRDFRSTGVPQKDNLIRMMRTASVNFEEARLEDVMAWFATTSGADIDVMWMDSRSGSGLDKDATVTYKADGRSLLTILEGVLERAGDTSGLGGGATWQMSTTGAMQVGTKDRLNKHRRVEVYPIRDLMLEPPNWTNSYELDLQQAIQQAGQQGGGGGGQSPFREREDQEQQRRTEQEKSDEIIDIIVSLVEPEQWQRNGGDAGTIRYFQGALLVNAPDYMHRQINGYPYWPKAGTRIAHEQNKRYVTFTMDAATNRLIGLESIGVGGGG